MTTATETELPPDLVAARAALEAKLGGAAPRVGVILGSGLGGLADRAEDAVSINYSDIPGLAASTVVGHASRWIIGSVAGVRVHLLAGRKHLYEGTEAARSAFATRLLAVLGVKLLIVTNAAGGISRKLWRGDLMLIRDHVNMQFRNPLLGANLDSLGPRFPDMSDPYDPAGGAIMRRAAQAEKIALREGVYLALTGPAYETRAEVEMLSRFGADAVGMSTVPEVLAARHAGMRVVGVSLITNSHVNKDATETSVTSHEEVIETGKEAGERFVRLVTRALPGLEELAGAK